ncbi:MAG: hypothetical protein ACRDD8_06390 [Bacteroidales bacterium]
MIRSFEDFMVENIDKNILYYKGVRSEFCLENTPKFEFESNAVANLVNQKIEENIHQFSITLTHKFYYPNTNMSSCSNEERNILGQILRLKPEYKHLYIPEAEKEEVLEEFPEYCRSFIVDELSKYEGRVVYMCDLASEITMGINMDGSATCSARKAIEYLNVWWDQADEYFEYEKNNFGEVINNPFRSPETYMVCMIIEGVRSILSQSSFVEEHWGEEIELTESMIAQILDEIKEVDPEF